MQESNRRKRALRDATITGADALLVTHAADIRYLSGFTGSSGALALAAGRAALFTDGRYRTQAREECPGLRVVIGNGSAAVRAVEWLLPAGVRRCAFDAGQTSVAALDAWRKALPGKLRRSFFLVGAWPVAKLREVKDDAEAARLRLAAALGCRLFDGLLKYIRPESTEMQVAAQLEYAARLAGAEAMSFETIVASGRRSALPHGRATNREAASEGLRHAGLRGAAGRLLLGHDTHRPPG